jgi:hypothetical protein
MKNNFKTKLRNKLYWDILPLEDRIEGTDLTIEQVMSILETLNERYF